MSATTPDTLSATAGPEGGSPLRAPVDLKIPRSLKERLIEWLFGAFAMVSILTAAGIVVVLFGESISFFQQVSFGQFFGDTQWTPLFSEPHFGIWPLITGTLLTTLIAISVALPLGLFAAIYLSEFASPRVRKIAKPALELLAGIPTVVYGYFALSFITPAIQSFIPGISGANALAAGLVMGLMITPIIASLSEDAIYAVPRSLREGASALGGTKVRTIFRVVLPAAASGITASVILGLSRAIGETMIVAIAAGMEPNLTLDPREPVQTMTAFIVQVSLGDTPAGSLGFQTIFAVGLMLFLTTLVFNVISFKLRSRLNRGGHA
jgi:phosphate transport system permease protein